MFASSNRHLQNLSMRNVCLATPAPAESQVDSADICSGVRRHIRYPRHLVFPCLHRTVITPSIAVPCIMPRELCRTTYYRMFQEKRAEDPRTDCTSWQGGHMMSRLLCGSVMSTDGCARLTFCFRLLAVGTI